MACEYRSLILKRFCTGQTIILDLKVVNSKAKATFRISHGFRSCKSWDLARKSHQVAIVSNLAS